MTDKDDPIHVLTPEECFSYLATEKLGRLVVRRTDDMDIFPINYVSDAGKIYFRSAEGTKMFSVALGNEVLFEVDHVAEGKAWSVVIKGQARIMQSLDEIHHADTLPLKPWIPTLKYNYVEITPRIISGRAFALGEEPERY